MVRNLETHIFPEQMHRLPSQQPHPSYLWSYSLRISGPPSGGESTLALPVCEDLEMSTLYRLLRESDFLTGSDRHSRDSQAGQLTTASSNCPRQEAQCVPCL
jgi:hypothetical protein